LKPKFDLAVLAAAAALTCAAANAQTTPPKMKMTTPIPESITTPDSEGTSIGTLKFDEAVDCAAPLQVQ
jgi:hypothetical protein